MAANQTINNNSISSVLDKEKLNGSNFLDWYRNLRIVLRNEQKLHHLEEALPEVPPATAPAAVRNAYTRRVAKQQEVAYIILVSMTLEIQKNLEDRPAFEILQELKTIFQQQVEQELFKTVKAFHACKHEEGQSVSTYVLKIKAYLDQMERLGYPMPLVFGAGGSELGLASYRSSEDYFPATCEQELCPFNFLLASYQVSSSELSLASYRTISVGTLKETLTEGTKGALHLGPERPRVYSDLTSEEKDRYNADIRATKILLQGLPKDIYSLINHYTDAKEIWDNVKMLLEGSKLIKEDRESQLGLRDSNYDQLYAYLKQHEGRQKRGQENNTQGAGAAGYGEGAQNIVGFANLEYFKEKMLLMQAKENGVKLDEEQLLFIACGQDNVVDNDMDGQPI
uniref:Zinc finger, CCHC-type n=1 Tax=Tanacetum cinerariifolium TaxID=118510 RepID=A0A699HD74_TANCI|nr:zinc finger, CCHC-type [Tanacetum cinerariifolium]